MDAVRQERPDESPILKDITGSLYTRYLAHTSRDIWYLRPWKNKQCIIPRNY